MIYRKEISVQTKGNDDILDITGFACETIDESGIKEGILHIFVVGSTAGLTAIEYESGLLEDFRNILNKLIPKNLSYKHNLAWHDDNGHSHLRASLLGPSLSIPIIDKKMATGTWQQIILVDFDTHPRRRSLIFQVYG